MLSMERLSTGSRNTHYLFARKWLFEFLKPLEEAQVRIRRTKLDFMFKKMDYNKLLILGGPGNQLEVWEMESICEEGGICEIG